MTRPRKPPWTLTCPYCGTEFTVSGHGKGGTRYCSPEHAEQAKRDRDRERMRTYWRTRPECEFEGCPNPIAAGTLCAGHYAQQRAGKPLAPLKHKPGKPWYTPAEPCLFPDCGEPCFCKGLCRHHDSQRRMTSLATEAFIAGFLRQEGICGCCSEPLLDGFEVDHAHDGTCADIHDEAHMCPACIRGFIHMRCNRGLVWIDRAIRAGRLVKPAPQLAAYLQGRPFLELRT